MSRQAITKVHQVVFRRRRESNQLSCLFYRCWSFIGFHTRACVLVWCMYEGRGLKPIQYFCPRRIARRASLGGGNVEDMMHRQQQHRRSHHRRGHGHGHGHGHHHPSPPITVSVNNADEDSDPSDYSPGYSPGGPNSSSAYVVSAAGHQVRPSIHGGH